jgi:hypothetical protein
MSGATCRIGLQAAEASLAEDEARARGAFSSDEQRVARGYGFGIE